MPSLIFSGFVDAEHFQPVNVLFGFMPIQVRAFDRALLPIPIGEID